MMPIYDISLSISNDLPVWPGDTPIALVRNHDMQHGELYTLSQITTTVHVGSHLDAPMHFVRDGYGVDQIDLNKLIGPCFVVDLPNIDSIDAKSLERMRGLGIDPLRQMTQSIEADNAVIKGVPKLKAAKVMSTDLRASACLVLAGLAAEGNTEVLRVYHLDRGYQRIEEKLMNLGANIERAGGQEY